MRITTRRSVGWLTSSKPAAAKMLRLPTWISSQLILWPGDVRYRIALDRACAAAPRDSRRSTRASACEDATAAEARAGEHAGHGPDAVVGLVLLPALPRHTVVADEADEGRARLDRAPADGLAVEAGDEPAGRLRLRVAAPGLLAEPASALLDREPCERLPRPELVPLALAVDRGPADA